MAVGGSTASSNGGIITKGRARAEEHARSIYEPPNGLPYHPAPFNIPLDDKDVSAPLLFIGQQNPLAASPGTTANAQASLHDEFHNASFMTRSAILGDDFPGIDHNNAEQPVRQHTLSETELQVLNIYRAFDLPELPLRQSLLEASPKDNEASLLLLQAVLLVGSLMRPDTVDKKLLDSYYQRVKALINSGYERNPLNILATMCLIQWYTPHAARDVSTDTARYWASCALGIAQQIGLHRQPERSQPDYGLRRRIWWTLYIRDSLMATAHGRPRMMSSDDMLSPSIDDFDDPDDLRAKIFVAYTEITTILYDLCNFLLKKKPSSDERSQIAQRLLNFCRSLPDGLRLQDADGWQLSPENAASIAASNLTFRLLQAMHLREQTRYLSSAFAFYGLVSAIPHLSSLRIAGLRAEADVALDVIEKFMDKLGTVRPAAANNLRNIRAIRKAINSKNHAGAKTTRPSDSIHDQASLNAASEMLGHLYGPQATTNLQNISTILNTSVFEAAPQHLPADVQQPQQQQQQMVPPLPTNASASGSQQPTPTNPTNHNNHHQIPPLQHHSSMPFQQVYPLPDLNGMSVNGSLFGGDAGAAGGAHIADFGEGFSPIMTSHFQENTWMRNWIDDLQLFPE
ncbi:Acetamidase regulatory protein [Cyphellophora attinorum]|uniref:Acetamidase regulatory protein n=1 Tax=Cyphellophora attinorum TaxID=1664694 RepID=A0A0N1HD01_9EURO|nr:Acetamidase regulatory protein [Phialophora attinorum]KPI42382.1 Acetamidase regulatory protein [Phialophora attinorum]